LVEAGGGFAVLAFGDWRVEGEVVVGEGGREDERREEHLRRRRRRR
jgi:hypothetical protein